MNPVQQETTVAQAPGSLPGQPNRNIMRAVALCAVAGLGIAGIGQYMLARSILAGFGISLMAAAMLGTVGMAFVGAALDRRSEGTAAVARHLAIGVLAAMLAVGTFYTAEMEHGRITWRTMELVSVGGDDVLQLQRSETVPAEIAACLEGKSTEHIAIKARRCMTAHQDKLNYQATVDLLKLALLPDVHRAAGAGPAPQATPEFMTLARAAFREHAMACYQEAEVARTIVTAQYSPTWGLLGKSHFDLVEQFDPLAHILRAVEPERAATMDAALGRKVAAAPGGR